MSLKVKNVVVSILFFALFCLFSETSYSASFDSFVKNLRDLFYSVQGKAVLFGYTKEFIFAEITEGSFKSGDLVVVKSDNLSGEELAYGEVEEVRGKITRIYITSLQKPLKKGVLVMGLKSLHANINIDDDNAYLKSLFLREKDIKLQSNKDEKTNVIINFSKKDETSYNYKVLTPSGRLLLIGKLSLKNGEETPAFSISMKLVFDENTGEYWMFKDNELYCHTCSSSKTVRVNTEGKVLSMYLEGKNLYLLTEREKTFVVSDGKVSIYDGLVTQGEKLLYISKEAKLYDLNKQKVISELPQKYDYVYYWNNGNFLGKIGGKLVSVASDNKIAELPIEDAPIIRVKSGKLYLYREIKENVPLSGEYLALYLDVYDLKSVSLLKRVEIKESFIDFDIDEKNGEIIALKFDGTVKRIKF